MASIGIIYGACGDRNQLTYAGQSAQSAKRMMPGVPCYLWTSLEGPYDSAFDKVIKLEDVPQFLPRMVAALETPFDRTLVIDNDTRFIMPCEEIFDVLDEFDMAAAHAPLRRFGSPRHPEAFAAYNCGVIVYRKTPEVMQFWKDWIAEYSRQRPVSSVVAVDQMVFAEMVYKSKLKFCTLPPEYNLRSIFPMFIGGRTCVKILHGKEPMLTYWEDRFRRLGRTADPQIFQPDAQALVLGIGLSRTGTSSLNEALQILGVQSTHFPVSHVEITRGATDTPIALGFQYLDLMYPGSKFILTVRRNVEEWLDSCEWLFVNHVKKQSDEQRMLFLKKLHHDLYGCESHDDFDRGRFRQAYFQHIDRVTKHFKGRESDLLIMDITAGDGWDKLCPFLNATVPGIQFPYRNTRPVKARGGTKRMDFSDEIESRSPQLVGSNRTEGLIELIESLQDYPNFNVLEVGSYNGVSTVEFLKRCKSVHTVDFQIRPQLLMATAQYGHRFTFTQKRSVDFLIQWVNDKKPKFDLVYLGSNHEFQNTCNEIAWSLKVIRPGGWLCGHDYAFQGVGGLPLNDRGVLRAVQATLGYPDRVFRDTSWIYHVS